MMAYRPESRRSRSSLEDGCDDSWLMASLSGSEKIGCVCREFVCAVRSPAWVMTHHRMGVSIDKGNTDHEHADLMHAKK